MARTMYRIRGIVALYKHICDRTKHPMTKSERAEFAAWVGEKVLRIEELCKECCMTPDDLPAPSRSAYYNLKNFDASHIPIGKKGRTKELKHSMIDTDLIDIFDTMSKEVFGKQREVMVVYYPYTTLKHTIRERDNVLYIRLSDALRNAPYEVKVAITTIMLCKIKGIKPHPKHTDVYREYVTSEEMVEFVDNMRQNRAMKIVTGTKGNYYDLEESFDRVNKTYFSGMLDKPILTWSERKTVRRFGHQDEAMATVVISRTLDDKSVPRFVLDYIMYHELLHVKHGTTYAHGRRMVHTQAFKRDEKRFERYTDARRWIDRP